MEFILNLSTNPIALLGPVFFFIFYAHDIFGYPKLIFVGYILGLTLGFLFWKPLVVFTFALAWTLIIFSFGLIAWGIFKQE